jgi:hypothetical protein
MGGGSRGIGVVVHKGCPDDHYGRPIRTAKASQHLAVVTTATIITFPTLSSPS